MAKKQDIIAALMGYARKGFKPPYDTLTSKQMSGGSKYNPAPATTKSSTLASGFMSAITSCIAVEIGESNKIAVGSCGVTTTVSEYRSAVPDIVDIIVYDQENGSFICCVYNTSTSSGSSYTLGKDTGDRNGAALIAAMLPTFLTDEEFKENYDALVEMARADYPDRMEAARVMAILCDNVYNRLKDETCPAVIPLEELSSKKMTFTTLRTAAITAGTYDPTSISLGNFELLGNGSVSTTSTGVPTKTIAFEDLIGKYPLSTDRKFTEEEKKLIEAAKPDKFYIIPEEATDICNAIMKTTNSNNPFRNFTFVGGAGTGKSSLAKCIAAGHGLPFVIFTCSANTEIFDIVGQVMPKSAATSGEINEKLLKQLESLGGITFENIAKVYNLPNIVDLEFDAAMSYEQMTGKEVVIDGDNFSVEGKLIGDEHEMFRFALNCWQQILGQKFNEIVDSMNSSGQTQFIYTETPFIRAVKYGWVVEVQEPNVILSEGVLVGLNGLLEEGKMTLPTGEIVYRHPDNIIIFTTNVSYNGCRAMNQSVIDRSHQVYSIEAPSIEVMAERACSISGNEDLDMVSEMAQIVKDMADEMVREGIDDGVCGMRSLANWATNATFENAYKAFEKCVLTKVSMDEDTRQSMKKRIEESSFRIAKRSRRA